MKDSRDQEVLIAPIVDHIALNYERPNAFTELQPIAAHARLFDKPLESVDDRVNESIGGRGAGILDLAERYGNQPVIAALKAAQRPTR